MLVSDAAAYTVICAFDDPEALPTRSAAAIATAAVTNAIPLTPRLLSALDHHRRRLDDGSRRHTGLESELVDGIAGDDRDQPDRIADNELDLCDQPVDLHVGDDALEAIARAEMRTVRVPPQAFDLARGNGTPVRVVALGLDASLPIPASQRVDADP